MSAIDAVRTVRLRGEGMQPEHFGLMRQIHEDPRVMATLGGVRTAQQTQEYLASQIEHWRNRGFGRWIFFSLASGKFVGGGGLRSVVIDQQDEVEVGYALLPAFWNRGLATEIAAKSVECAFTELGLTHLVCFTLPTNLASRRVMEKCGFKFDRAFVWADLPHVLYRLRRSDWATADKTK